MCFLILSGKASDWNAKLQEALAKAGYSTNAPLYIDEIFTNCSGPAATSACADATLEEVSILFKFCQDFRDYYDICMLYCW